MNQTANRHYVKKIMSNDKDISLLRQRELLKLEYEYEKKEFLQTAEVTGIRRKMLRGECWYPVTFGRSYYNALGNFVVEIMRSETDDDEQEPAFDYGKPLRFFSVGGSGSMSHFPFQATVNRVEKYRMIAVLPNEASMQQLQRGENIGLMLSFDETTYRLMFEALDKVINASDNRLAHLRDIVHGGLKPQFSQGIAPEGWLPWLNRSQEKAVNMALVAKDVMVVHGPPGTGKTTTLVEAICEVVRREPQVLVCAQSNTAVDWISLQLASRGLGVLRIGNPSRVTDEMLAFTYERRFESHPDYPLLWQLRKSIRQLRSASKQKRSESYHQQLSRLRDRADSLEVAIRNSLFDSSRVIACTLAGAASAVLTNRRFHTLFIDEAAQALEAATWIALQKADRAILAGDHQQLPPTVKSHEAMRQGLARSLMETFAVRHPEAVKLLTLQYRMNETLMRFSSDKFYSGQVKAAPEVKGRNVIDFIGSPLVWIDTDTIDTVPVSPDEKTGETYVAESCGRVNIAEARMTVEALLEQVEGVGVKRFSEERMDIGVISPYRAQVSLLRSMIKRERKLRPLAGSISVNTVDAFQGQERDIIILSLVRQNDKGSIGFLSDLRRMNVAMTRARSRLVILSSASTMCCHGFYKDLFELCSKETLGENASLQLIK